MRERVIYQNSICPLCPYGCELGIELRRGFFVRINHSGPLCARGNAVPLILSSPKRLYSPCWQGRDIPWESALFEAERLLKNFSGREIVIAFDSSLTLKEREIVRNLGQVLGTKEILQFNLEGFTSYQVEGIKIADQQNLQSAEVFLVIGDLLSRFPLFARVLLSAKYERKAKILVFDNYPNRLSEFADEVFFCPPGREVEFLRKGEEKIFSQFAQAKRGVLILDAPPGKFFDPFGLHLASQIFLLAGAGEKYFLPVSQMIRGDEIRPAGEVLAEIEGENIPLFLFFGEEVPIWFPKSEYAIYFTPWQFNCREGKILFLPTRHILEKGGEILTFWGKVFKNSILPHSGTKDLMEILSGLIANFELKDLPSSEGTTIGRKSAERFLIEGDKALVSLAEPEGEGFWLLNDEEAIEFGGYFAKGDWIKISPAEAKRIGVKEGDMVFLRQDGDKIKLRVKIKDGLSPGYASISLAHPENKELFKISIDSRIKEIIMRPTFVNIWKGE